MTQDGGDPSPHGSEGQHLHFLQSLDRVHRALSRADDLEELLGDTLGEVLSIFGCDRAWLSYPCDPQSPTWRSVMERTVPEFPPALPRNMDVPTERPVADAFTRALATDGAYCLGPDSDPPLGAHATERYQIRSQMTMALTPAEDRPYLFGIHQCTHGRTWTTHEQRLFVEIGRRFSDGLNRLLVLRRLRESERHLAEAQRIAHIGHWKHDLFSDDVTWSDETYRIFGYEPGTLSPTCARWTSLIHPEDLAARDTAMAHAIATGEPYAVEYRVVRPDGSTRSVECEGSVQFGDDGKALRLFGVVRDVTERRRAEAELRGSEARFRVFVDHATDGFFLHDADGRILDANRQACESLGYTRDELVGEYPSLFDTAFAQLDLKDLRERMRAGQTPTFESVHRRRDGTEFPVELRMRSFRDSAAMHSVSLVRDITERKQMEAQLRQSQKMEAVGQLAGGVAHDFNNLLTVINGYSKLVLETLAAGDANRDPLEEIRRAGERAARLTRQLLAFSRKQVLQPQLVDVNLLLLELQKLLQRLIGEDVEVQMALAPALGQVRVDPGQFEQAVMNVALNARDAMPVGGVLRIESCNVAFGPAATAGNGTIRPGHYVCVTVRDTGTGMDAAVAARIFEPFFTTKEQGKGTGLGLSMVYGFVTQSGGHVDVETAIGHGTALRIYLPCETSREPEAQVQGAELGVPRGRETVLLVEDEDAVRSLSTRMLRSCGYTVLEASDGEQALAVAAQHGEPIHMLVTDVVMPRMNGPRLAQLLRARQPSLRVLLVSGYSGDALRGHVGKAQELTLLHKPYGPMELARKVREMLDAGSGEEAMSIP